MSLLDITTSLHENTFISSTLRYQQIVLQNMNYYKTVWPFASVFIWLEMVLVNTVWSMSRNQPNRKSNENWMSQVGRSIVHVETNKQKQKKHVLYISIRFIYYNNKNVQGYLDFLPVFLFRARNLIKSNLL